MSAAAGDVSQQLTRKNSAVTRELPGNSPYHVKVDMIREYIKGWWAPSQDIVFSMDSNLRTQLSAIVLDIFRNYTPGGLHGLVGYVDRPFPASVTSLMGQ